MSMTTKSLYADQQGSRLDGPVGSSKRRNPASLESNGGARWGNPWTKRGSIVLKKTYYLLSF